MCVCVCVCVCVREYVYACVSARVCVRVCELGAEVVVASIQQQGNIAYRQSIIPLEWKSHFCEGVLCPTLSCPRSWKQTRDGWFIVDRHKETRNCADLMWLGAHRRRPFQPDPPFMAVSIRIKCLCCSHIAGIAVRFVTQWRSDAYTICHPREWQIVPGWAQVMSQKGIRNRSAPDYFSQSCLLFTTLCGHLFAVLAYKVILGSVELNSGVLRVEYFDGS